LARGHPQGCRVRFSELEVIGFSKAILFRRRHVPFYPCLASGGEIGAVLGQAMSYFAFAVFDVIAELLNVGGAYAVARADFFDLCFGPCFVSGARTRGADHYDCGGYDG